MNNKEAIRYYMLVLRIGALCTSVALWIISVQFSVAGFDITLPGYTWVGWVLAATVTILQLIFNRGVYDNPTLFLAGILAYAYGIITNIIGIMRVQEIMDNIVSNVSDNPGQYVPGIIFAIVLALVIEIVPEALLLWSLFTDQEKLGDFISSVLRGTNVQKQFKMPSNHAYGQRTGQPQTRQDNRQDSGQRTGQPQTRHPDGQYHGQAGQDKKKEPLDPDEKSVISYCNTHFRKHGSLPVVRKVEHETGINKTKVAEIMKPLRSKWKKS